MTNTVRYCCRCGRYQRPGTRRYRCTGCDMLVCSLCCNRGGSGQGANSTRWATCYDCEAKRKAVSK